MFPSRPKTLNIGKDDDSSYDEFENSPDDEYQSIPLEDGKEGKRIYVSTAALTSPVVKSEPTSELMTLGQAVREKTRTEERFRFYQQRGYSQQSIDHFEAVHARRDQGLRSRHAYSIRRALRETAAPGALAKPHPLYHPLELARSQMRDKYYRIKQYPQGIIQKEEEDYRMMNRKLRERKMATIRSYFKRHNISFTPQLPEQPQRVSITAVPFDAPSTETKPSTARLPVNTPTLDDQLPPLESNVQPPSFGYSKYHTEQEMMDDMPVLEKKV